MKTSQKYYTHFEKIVLNSINLEPYEIVTTNLFDTFNEVYNIFLKEYVHNNNQQINEVVLFSEWLQGLPSALSVPFSNYEILQNALKDGLIINYTEQSVEFPNKKTVQKIKTDEEDKFLNTYFMNISKAFFTLKENY